MRKKLSEDRLMELGCTTITTNEDGSINYWNKDKDFSVDVERLITPNGIELIFKYRVFERKRTRILNYVEDLQRLHLELKGEPI